MNDESEKNTRDGISESGPVGQLPLPPEADLLPSILKCVSLSVAGDLGLFTILSNGSMTISEIAEALKTDKHGTGQLLELLAGFGYLEKEEDKYKNGAPARTWYEPNGISDFTPFLKIVSQWWPYLGKACDVIREGGPRKSMYQVMEETPEIGRNFANYMAANAVMFSNTLPDISPLPDNAARLLDLGGSHGIYSMAFCRKYQGLNAVVFDLPAALLDTEGRIADAGLEDRMTVQRGDYLKDPLGGDYDAVLMFGIIDGNQPDENRALFKKVASALKPGGRVLVHSHLRTEPQTPANAQFSMMMYLAYGTQAYSVMELSDWLTDAGFEDIRPVPVPPANMTILTVATLGNVR